MAPPVVRLISSSVRFGVAVALALTDLTVQTGRTTVLIGPSGCDKTTALRLMLGLLRPDTGEVLFQQSPLTRDRLLQARAHMRYVVQDAGSFPDLIARGNVELMARHLGWPEQHTKQRVTEHPDPRNTRIMSNHYAHGHPEQSRGDAFAPPRRCSGDHQGRSGDPSEGRSALNDTLTTKKTSADVCV